MVDDGRRLTFSIKKNSFHIYDNLSGESVLYNSGKVLNANIPFDSIRTHLECLQEALLTYERNRVFFKKIPGPVADDLYIVEESHFSWMISYRKSHAIVKDGRITHTSGFSCIDVLALMNMVFATTLSLKPTLCPKKDIVRRIVDIGLLVWVHDGDSVVVFENNVSGNTMTNCLVNGDYYPVLLVSTSVESNCAVLVTPDMEEVVSFPVDQSVLTYYPSDDSVFD